MLQSRDSVSPMPDAPAVGEAVLEVISPDGSRQRVRVAESPFFIGRGEAGNHLPIPDKRISRRCATIVSEGGRYHLEDRGHHAGIFVNGKTVAKEILKDGDVVSFGLDDSHKLVFRFSQDDATIQTLLTRMESVAETDDNFRGTGEAESIAGGDAAAALAATARRGAGGHAGSRHRRDGRGPRTAA